MAIKGTALFEVLLFTLYSRETFVGFGVTGVDSSLIYLEAMTAYFDFAYEIGSVLILFYFWLELGRSVILLIV